MDELHNRCAELCVLFKNTCVALQPFAVPLGLLESLDGLLGVLSHLRRHSVNFRARLVVNETVGKHHVQRSLQLRRRADRSVLDLGSNGLQIGRMTDQAVVIWRILGVASSQLKVSKHVGLAKSLTASRIGTLNKFPCV